MNVLYIEDSVAQSKTGIRAVRRLGGEIVVAETGAAAFEAIQTHRFDVILCDLQLPDIDGIVLIQRLHSQLPTTPIIVLTGVTLPGHREVCLQAGGTEYLVKPLDTNEVESILRKYFSSASR